MVCGLYLLDLIIVQFVFQITSELGHSYLTQLIPLLTKINDDFIFKGLAVRSECRGCQVPGISDGDLVILKTWGMNYNSNKPENREIDYEQLGYVQRVRPYYEKWKARQCVLALKALC